MKQSQDKLGQMPIGKLLITMSVPMMVSMFIQALYNVVDSIFVAKLSEDALTAVSLAYPLQNILIAVSVGTGVGVNACVSRALGEGNIKRAEKAANVQVFLGVVYTLITILIGIFFVKGFYTTQTDAQTIIEYGTKYASIVCIFSLGMYLSQGFEKLLIATGNATASMISQALGAITNIILDPIMIFTLKMGVTGAAVATVIGQYAAAICSFLLNLKYNKATRFHIREMLPDFKILKFIYSVGFPSMITVGLSGIMSYLMNNIFLAFSTTATAVFGIWLKLQSFGFMPVFGMNNGTIAIYSYNFGAGKIDRVHQTLRISMILGLIITAAVTLLYELIPVSLLKLFNASDYMLSFAVTALRICSFSMIFGAASIIISSACQSLGGAHLSLIINVARQVVIQVAAAWILSRFGRLELVWYAPLIAEALTVFIAVIVGRKVLKKLDAPRTSFDAGKLA